MSKLFGRRVTADELARFAPVNLDQGPFRPSGITLHHTAAPSLAQRPQGFTEQHARNLWSYYTETLGWSAGPHIFIDDQPGFIILTRLNERGVHAASFNSSRWGIEVLGWYDKGKDDPFTGRGLECWRKAAQAARILAGALGKEPLVGKGKTINFHRDDWRTRKTCPGNLITPGFVQDLILAQDLRPAEWIIKDTTGDIWPGPWKESKGRVLIRRADAAEYLDGWGLVNRWPVLDVDSAGAGWSHIRDVLNILRVDGPSKTIVYDGLAMR